MKKTIKIIMTLAAVLMLSLFLLSGCGKKGLPALHVDGTHLADEKGNLVQLRGLSTHGIAWFPQYVDKDCIHELKELFGINVLRIAMYTAENGGYCTDGDKEALKALVMKGVDICEEEGIYAIIDWHILRDGNPKMNQDEAIKFFDEMSAKYADKTHVLYEICNEPNGDRAHWPEILEYAETVIPVIRAHDPDAIIICGTPSFSKLSYAAEKNRLDDPNVVYTQHFYAASDISLRKDLQRAIDGGVPVFVSEFGIVEANGNGAADTESGDAWMEILDEYGISYVMWNISNKDEGSAIFKADVTKTSSFTLDDMNESAVWYYHHLTGK